MSNIQKLKKWGGILGDIRQRLGAENENDASFDEKINEMDARSLVNAWSTWHLGYESWGEDIIDMYEFLKCSEK